MDCQNLWSNTYFDDNFFLKFRSKTSLCIVSEKLNYDIFKVFLKKKTVLHPGLGEKRIIRI